MYKSNYEFKENITIDFSDWDVNKDFLGKFKVKSILIPNQDIIFDQYKGQFTVKGIWNKNNTWYDLEGLIDIVVNPEDLKKLAEKLQNDTLIWEDVNSLKFKYWRVYNEES